ncbi:flagellar hook-basal body complex protein FliE [Pannonibacter sp. Q-1]
MRLTRKSCACRSDARSRRDKGLTASSDAGQKSEGMALGLVQGKADVVDVVTAIAETEVALETMVSVRDRVIAAYEEIMRMSI